MNTTGRTLTIALACLVLASCGPMNSGGLASQVGALVVGAASPQQPQAAPQGIPQEEIAANPGNYMRVNIRNQNTFDTMVRAGENGSRVTWVNSANISMTLENGIIVATRGLPRDLMAANVSETWSAIRAGGGISQRQHEFLTDLDGISAELLQCRIASQGPEVIERLQIRQNSVRFEENCKGESLQFTNVYWVSDAGNVIRSLQAISPGAGYVQIDVY